MTKGWSVGYLQLGDAFCKVIDVCLFIHRNTLSMGACSGLVRVVRPIPAMLRLDCLDAPWHISLVVRFESTLSLSCKVKVALQVIRHLVSY